MLCLYCCVCCGWLKTNNANTTPLHNDWLHCLLLHLFLVTCSKMLHKVCFVHRHLKFFFCVYFDKEEKKKGYDTIWQRCRTMQYCNAFEMSHLKAYIKAIFCQHWHVVLIAFLSRHRVAAVHRTRQYNDEFFFGFFRTKFSKMSRLVNSDSQSITVHSYLGQHWCFARLRAHTFNSIHLLHSCTFI